MVHGSPTPRNHERGIPGNARNRPGSGRPQSAKPTVIRNPITVRITIIDEINSDIFKSLNMLSSATFRV